MNDKGNEQLPQILILQTNADLRYSSLFLRLFYSTKMLILCFMCLIFQIE